MPYAVPAAIGIAAASLLGNQLNAAADAESKAQGRQWLGQASANADAQYNAIINQIGDYYANRGSLGRATDVQAYRDAINGYDTAGSSYMPTRFEDEYSKTVDDFENPYKEAMLGDVVAQIQHSAAGAGLGRGSGAAQAIAQGVLDKSLELRRQAQDEYNTDRNFAYTKYNDYIQNMNQALAQRQQAMNNKLTLQGNLAQDYFNVMDAGQGDMLKAQQDRIATGTQYSTAMAGLY